MVPPSSPERHRHAVELDYNRRVREWRTIYGGTTFHDDTIRRRLGRVLALVDRVGAGPGAALDVGCGAGQLLVELGRRGFEVHGCDLAEGMAVEARAHLAAHGLEGDVRTADSEVLPYPDARFRWVTALGLIEYLADPQRGVLELARVTAPGGHVVVTAPNPVRLAYLLDPIGVVRARLAPPAGGYRRRYWPPWRLRALVARAGLRPLHVEGHGLGPLTLAGRPLMGERRAIALGHRLERDLPGPVTRLLGANLVCLARKDPA